MNDMIESGGQESREEMEELLSQFLDDVGINLFLLWSPPLEQVASVLPPLPGGVGNLKSALEPEQSCGVVSAILLQ